MRAGSRSFSAGDSALHRLYANLGPATVLVEVDSGQPRFRLAAAGLPTLAASRTEAHQLCLAEGDVAAAFGAVSDGLHALGFADKVKLDTFIADNPGLRGARIVEHPGYAALLLRVDGPAPNSRADGDFMWLSDGSTVTVLLRAGHGWHAFPPGKPPASVPRMRLDTLAWNSLNDFGLTLLRDVLEAAHGNRFSGSVAKRGRLNGNFWADFLSRVLSMRFHARRKQFQEQDAATGSWDDRSQLVVSNLAGGWVWKLTAKWGQPFRASPAELRHLVARLQVLVARDVPEERDFFRDCLLAVVERCEDSNVTNDELHAAISHLHRQEGRPMPSLTLAGRWMNQLMAEMFSAPHHRNLVRDDKWKRGFRGFQRREPFNKRI